MLISGENNQSTILSCLAAAPHFLLSEAEALEIIARQVLVTIEHWDEVCILADLNETDRSLFWGRQFLNPFAFENLEGDAASIKSLVDEGREKNRI
jgi:serine/threonine-protein kinase HipA